MPTQDDIWYAANMTQVVLEPKSTIETFGETSFHYYIISDLLDQIGQVRIRQGRMIAARPKVITPHYLVSQAMHNFSPEARRYAEDVLSSREGAGFVQYGLHFSKEEYGEEVVGGQIAEISAQVRKDAEARDAGLCGVIVGVDDLWEVSLLKFAWDLIRSSAPRNIRDLSRRGLLESSHGVPNAVRIELESDFRAAEGDRAKIEELGKKLTRYGVFKPYEERFFSLWHAARK